MSLSPDSIANLLMFMGVVASLIVSIFTGLRDSRKASAEIDASTVQTTIALLKETQNEARMHKKRVDELEETLHAIRRLMTELIIDRQKMIRDITHYLEDQLDNINETQPCKSVCQSMVVGTSARVAEHLMRAESTIAEVDELYTIIFCAPPPE